MEISLLQSWLQYSLRYWTGIQNYWSWWWIDHFVLDVTYCTVRYYTVLYCTVLYWNCNTSYYESVTALLRTIFPHHKPWPWHFACTGVCIKIAGILQKYEISQISEISHIARDYPPSGLTERNIYRELYWSGDCRDNTSGEKKSSRTARHWSQCSLE